MGVVVEFFDDPGTFLATAGPLLAEHAVEATILVTVTERMRRTRPAWLEDADFPVWWAVERDGDRVVGAAMRTAPFAPHPAYLVRMSDAGAAALAGALHARGEEVGGANGTLPATEVFASEVARLAGRAHRTTVHTRLFVLDELHAPDPPGGRARLARPDEVDLALAWYDAFGRDAAEQAGRSEPHAAEEMDRAGMLDRIEGGTVWVWEDAQGVVVHLTGASRPMFGVARIGPVYTPPELRGRGYGGATVAEVSRSLRAEGAEVCLFTDQANPVSNALYERLGFRRVADQAAFVIS